MTYLSGQKVKFVKGEHVGKLGTVHSTVPRYLKGEEYTIRVVLDGFPIPGGWNGKVTVPATFVERA